MKILGWDVAVICFEIWGTGGTFRFHDVGNKR